ncbi:LppP/LprE family lipoprotein [Candidatus Frankia nodulisporulans]|uniref:LppP/LprE family lipoprotein n=2 Tax=Candidatus Frankia nodulisporulans TaxID=2060052 RepID=UPI0013D1B3E2
MTLRHGLAMSVLVGALSLTGGLTATATAATGASTVSDAPSAGQAAAVVRAAGYTPISFGGYDAANDLSVIIGLLSTSGDGHPQRAFLFHHATLVGYDAPQPSATIRWIWSTDRQVALQYDLYRPGDPMCCPSAGGATVRYAWNGSGVSRLDSLPSATTSAATSRR